MKKKSLLGFLLLIIAATGIAQDPTVKGLKNEHQDL